jgi:hypothetical protein
MYEVLVLMQKMATGDILVVELIPYHVEGAVAASKLCREVANLPASTCEAVAAFLLTAGKWSRPQIIQ